ncbi:hypothetical protein INT43_002695 [Umbelopsis isabellina]|uniref:Cytochrome b5 heme-binding domain-containing protein n=1 Tax=Mortierella isabellina TaxID=91625 RepID=A0A8H7Q5C6_MORIS|nr:hypothetical protein INT43_002695 [Umbelopsis isabellina]
MVNKYTVEQVATHNSESDCWVIIHDKVYDVTNFLKEHPGGKKVLLKASGTDATKQFDAFHNSGVLAQYGPGLLIGEVGTGQEDNSEEEEEWKTSPVAFGDPMWQTLDSPYYKESHKALRTAVRNFVDKEITPYCHEWDEAKQLPMAIFKKVAEAGILGCVVGKVDPELMPYDLPGGFNKDELDPWVSLVTVDELSRCGSGGVVWSICGGLGIGLPPIIHFGSDYLKKKVVRDCLAGDKVICLAITEPTAGSDVASLVTEARDEGDHYIVNGEKKWITNGVFADYFTVAVRTGEPGFNGLSLLLIERNMPGVSTRQMKCSGVWPSGTAYVTFEDVKVPKENLIGEENQGFRLIVSNFNQERFGIIIQATRFARVCVEESLIYANKRRTFGKRLIDHPVIRNKLGHMIRQVEATQAWLEALAYQAQQMEPEEQALRLGGPIALLKAQSTQTFEFCAREASQIFGGLSYTRGGQGEKIERLAREVRGKPTITEYYTIPGGSEEVGFGKAINRIDLNTI